MPAMQVAGAGHQLSEHARVRRDPDEYVIELAAWDFSRDELEVEVLGSRITVRGDQRERPGDGDEPFRIYERLEESFRIPDDADAGRAVVFHRNRTLEIHVPRLNREPRRLPIEDAPQHLLNPEAEPC